MAKIVNNHNAPGPLIRYAQKPHYDSGDSDFTATSLMDEPRIKILTEIHSSEIEDDPYVSPWKYLSTIFHELLSQDAGPGEIAEERLFTIFEGKKISGAMDLQIVLKDENGKEKIIIGDYKLTGAYSLRDTSKWEQQLNIYRWLVEREKPDSEVIGLEIYAFIRDFSMATAERTRDYPSNPGVTLQLPMWDDGEAEEFVRERMSLHCEAEKNLPDCSHGGRWPGGKKWQVWEDDILLDTFRLKRDATAAFHGSDADNAEIVEVVGRYRRCESFCPVSSFCTQNLDWLKRREKGYRRK